MILGASAPDMETNMAGITWLAGKSHIQEASSHGFMKGTSMEVWLEHVPAMIFQRIEDLHIFSWLVVWNMDCFFPYIGRRLRVIIPRSTTNQWYYIPVIVDLPEIYPTKNVIFPVKMVILPVKMVIFPAKKW